MPFKVSFSSYCTVGGGRIGGMEGGREGTGTTYSSREYDTGMIRGTEQKKHLLACVDALL